ncbi:MAG: sodium-dependent transporter [Ruminococcaceae bacterium]|nr:sodium-dependent transporter [Oscillospiraceae bacterium]
MKREQLGSRLGFILLSAGCAIGIGNVWKFPYLVGENGGAIFVLFYLLFLAVLGVPIMTMEFAIGRAAQKSPVKMYQELEPKGSKWHLHGIPALIGNYLLMMFYTVVTGWMIHYFVFSVQGQFRNASTDVIKNMYDGMLASPFSMMIFTAIGIMIAVAAGLSGLQKGIERVTKYMMLALLAIILVLAVNSCLLPGAKEGLAFYLIPDLHSVEQAGGIGKVIVNAMNQSFFTLSIGIGSMAIFGSYLKKDRSLLGEATTIACLDTFVALSAGLIIFPAIFTYGLKPDSGPSLIFITLPNIFANMPLGQLWGSLFFVFMSFAALSTLLAVFENIVACWMDFGFSRTKATLINGVLLFALSMPCILGYNVWKGFSPFGGTSTVQNLEDFLVSQILLPLGSLMFVLFCTSRYGWGFEKFKAEANLGKGLKVKNWMRGYMTYVLPLIIAVLFVIGIVDTFI